MKRVVIVLLVALGALAGCTSDPAPTPGRTSTVIDTRTLTRPPTSGAPLEFGYVPSLPPGTKPPAGERDGTCPYIKAGVDIEPTDGPNLADLEGNRVGRVTVLTRHKPVGCRFYFYTDFHPVADIIPTTYPSAAAAHAALVATGEAGRNARGYRNFVKGVDGINFRTKFYSQDGGNDWAWAFAKGRVLVVVRTDQNKAGTAFNSRYVAEAIVGKF
ncbi:hypothetical protein [Jatrophihabitans fulvus]